MRGGGSYYMMSRSLGPELGGAIGCLFYAAFAVGSCFYAVGFATEVQETWFSHHKGPWLLRGIASVALLFVLGVALMGARYFTKINVPLFIIQFAATWIAIGSMLFGSPKGLAHGGEFTGPKLDNFLHNANPHYMYDKGCNGMCNTNIVFSIIFPAATGIMEGANLSGDLANPMKSIGKGTLLALGASAIHYVILIGVFSFGFDGHTLRMNPTAMQDATVSEYIVIAGVVFSSLSSSLGAIFGGSRVLQALGRDQILPFLPFFAKGSKQGNEPRRAVIFSWFIAQCCVMIGDLDVLAPLISSIFCLSYAMTNLACFLVRVAGTPNFRPKFHYFNQYTAFAGFVLNIAVMFYLNVWYALVSIILFSALLLYLVYHAPETSWGDVRQAIIFHQVRKYLLKLDVRKTHPKNWRPSVMLMVDDINSPLVDFCNYLKKGGLYVLGAVLVGDFNSRNQPAMAISNRWLSLIEAKKLKAFPQVTVGSTALAGYQNLLMLSGLGAMTPNTIVLPFFESPNERGRMKRRLSHLGSKLGRQTSVSVSAADEVKANDDDLDDADRFRSNASQYGSIGTPSLSSQVHNSAATASAKITTPKSTASMPPMRDSPRIERSLSVYYTRMAERAALNDFSGSLLGKALRDQQEYVAMVEYALTMDKNVILARNFDSLFVPAEQADEPTAHHDLSLTIDVWLTSEKATSSWGSFSGTPLMLIQLAAIIVRKTETWSQRTKLRVCRVVNEEYANRHHAREERLNVKRLLDDARIDVDEIVILMLPDCEEQQERSKAQDAGARQRKNKSNQNGDAHAEHAGRSIQPPHFPYQIGVDLCEQRDFEHFNSFVFQHSSDSYAVFMELPEMSKQAAKSSADADLYMECLRALTNDLPPTALVASGARDGIMSRDM
eukprot:TRINITY_DN58260_c0_g1_i1.p1 TRINITY_DN58260_c0_g1~~TRINITY_DN58260_c0_g1_i1.p1  ORF type:complete len:1001 (-),score=502.59 TRINITY_DN58260_c0_g1_i1:118-2793(-)